MTSTFAKKEKKRVCNFDFDPPNARWLHAVKLCQTLETLSNSAADLFNRACSCSFLWQHSNWLYLLYWLYKAVKLVLNIVPLSTSWHVHYCRNNTTRPFASAKRKDATPTSPSTTHSCGEDSFMPFEKLKHFNHGSESQSWILRTCECDRGSHYVHKVHTVRFYNVIRRLDHSPPF